MVGENGEQNRRAHLLIVPGGGAGHFYPCHHILYLLSAPQYVRKIIVTVADIDGTLAKLGDLKERGEFGSLDLRFEEMNMDYIPKGVIENLGVIPGPEKHVKLIEKTFEPLKKKLLLAKGQADAPTCIMSDMFYTFLVEVAEELEVPWYPMVPASVRYTYGCYLSANPLLRSRDPEVRKQNVPGLEFARIFDFPDDVLAYPEFFATYCERFKRSKGIIINDVEAWDASVGSVSGLRYYLKSEHIQTPRVLLCGPLVNVDGFRLASPTSNFEDSQKPECLTWLDKQPSSSVLYISFGSMLNIPPDGVRELAHGLEETGVSFLWVVKTSPGETLESVLPEGFVERIQGRGFLETGFAPQTKILQHPSVRGFMSHCGWNSSLESICSGVPLITWPLNLDQLLNARFIVNVWKAGVGIKKADEDYRSFVTRKEVSKAIEIVMIGGHKEVKNNVQKLKSMAVAAIKEGGPSYTAIHSFAEEIVSSARSITQI